MGKSPSLPTENPTRSHDTLVVLDFGSQTAQLITRRVRDVGVYAEMFSWDAPAETVLALQPKGFILSGGPASVYEVNAPSLPAYVIESGLPVLGICYGMQLLTHALGGKVAPARQREYGSATLSVTDNAPLWNGLPSQLEVWMSHGDRIEATPPGFSSIATSENSSIAAMSNIERGYYGVQFHPEVTHTPQGTDILRNFLIEVCGSEPTWTPLSFIEDTIGTLRGQIDDGSVVLGLSGGVDSAVTAALLQRAVGDRLTCIFVNNGLLRKGEPETVVETFQHGMDMHLIAVNAVEEFMSALANISDPEVKRKRIGELFVRIFEAEARKLGSVDFLAQGTIYPDVIESAAPADGDETAARRIKSHHNVGGLPPEMELQLVEPLRYLFKDEVRRVGQQLGLPDSIVWRQPFPGPGLAVRCLGEVTWERLERLRAADAILLDELDDAGLLAETSQAFAVLLPVRSVGVMGDGRTYQEVVALRAVTTDDFMTADWARLPHQFLAHTSNRIVNEVAGVNRVVYDVTSKPPATIEWE